MSERWRKFRRLSHVEQSLVLEAAGALFATWIGLRVFGFRRWKQILAFFIPADKTTGGNNAAPERELALVIARMEAAAARNIFLHANCLEQSLVLWWLLRRRGIDAALRLGARKESGTFEAHAWVEWDGEVVNLADREHQHFAPFENPVLSVETRIE
jgi:hypothetical protein